MAKRILITGGAGLKSFILLNTSRKNFGGYNENRIYLYLVR